MPWPLSKVRILLRESKPRVSVPIPGIPSLIYETAPITSASTYSPFQ